MNEKFQILPPFIKNGLLNKDILGNTFLGCNATPINESPKLWHYILWKPVTFYFISKETQCFKGGAWSGYSPLCKSTWGSLELLLLNLVQNMYYTDMLNANSVTGYGRLACPARIAQPGWITQELSRLYLLIRCRVSMYFWVCINAHTYMKVKKFIKTNSRCQNAIVLRGFYFIIILVTANYLFIVRLPVGQDISSVFGVCP